MKFKNVKIYGLEESIIRSGYPHQTGEPFDIEENQISSENAQFRAKKLAKTPVGSGHNNFLKGIIVQFDMQYPQYFTPQLQRYNWIGIISSQSKIHSLTKITNLYYHCNKYVLPSQLELLNWLISEVYNKDTVYPFKFHSEATSFGGKSPYTIESKEECFQYIISNLPMGFELWMGISTNYLQLKTIYHQRKKHKLIEWREFCDWIETLPMSYLITGKDEASN